MNTKHNVPTATPNAQTLAAGCGDSLEQQLWTRSRFTPSARASARGHHSVTPITLHTPAATAAPWPRRRAAATPPLRSRRLAA